MDSDSIQELLTEEQFAEYLSRGGIIVIHDDQTKAGSKRVAHLQSGHKTCSHVDVADFRMKVLANAQANRRYRWARNSRVAERDLQARLCTSAAV